MAGDHPARAVCVERSAVPVTWRDALQDCRYGYCGCDSMKLFTHQSADGLVIVSKCAPVWEWLWKRQQLRQRAVSAPDREGERERVSERRRQRPRHRLDHID